MTRDIKLENLQRLIGYKFKDRKILERALRHSSVSGEHNERLEFLGDSILNNVISIKLYELYADRREGCLTTLRSRVICNKNLANIAQSKLKLQDYIEINRDAVLTSGFKPFFLADFLEALVGAIYVDSDETAAKQFVMQFCWDPTKVDFAAHVRYNHSRPTSAGSSSSSSSGSRGPFQQPRHVPYRRNISQTRFGPSVRKFVHNYRSPRRDHPPSNDARKFDAGMNNLKTILLSEQIPFDDMTVTHGDHHKEQNALNKHSITMTISKVGCVRGWGSSVEDAKCDAVNLMTAKTNKYLLTTNHRENRLVKAIMSLGHHQQSEPTASSSAENSDWPVAAHGSGGGDSDSMPTHQEFAAQSAIFDSLRCGSSRTDSSATMKKKSEPEVVVID